MFYIFLFYNYIDFQQVVNCLPCNTSSFLGAACTAGFVACDPRELGISFLAGVPGLVPSAGVVAFPRLGWSVA